MQAYTFSLPHSKNGKFSFIAFEKHFDDDAKIASELWDNYRRTIIGLEGIILRPPVEIPLNDTKQTFQKKYQRVIERFENLPIFLLYSNNFTHKISGNINDKAATKDLKITSDIIPYIRQREMEQFVLKSNAIFRSPANSIFRTPSFEYTYNFLRVGNIQITRRVLDAIFFWTLPYLNNKGALLTDSWSISSMALNISRLLYRYVQPIKEDDTSREVLEARNWAKNFHVNFLSTFYHGKRSMSKETSETLQPLLYNSDKKILFLISAIKTENSIKAIKKEIEGQGYSEKVEYLSLFDLLKEGRYNTLCCLADEYFIEKSGLGENGFDSYKNPPKKETVIVIDEKTFFPLQVKSRQILINRKAFQEHKDFFKNYCGHKVISIHRNAYFTNQTEVQRHHGIFIDVGKLITHPVFLDKLKTKLSLLSKAPKIIIFPPHSQGEKFVSKITEIIKENSLVVPETLCFVELEKLAPTLKETYKKSILNCNENDLILVVDDVCTTGNRLKSYQKILRELSFAGRIHYLVGVARLASQNELSILDRDLKYPNHSFDYVENIFLPNWYDKECPWCCEIELLNELLAKPNYEGFKANLFERKTMLENLSEVGLYEECFYDFNKGGKPAFQQGSIAPLKKNSIESEVVACFACAIQYLRNIESEEKRLGVEYPLYKILRVKDYLGDTFNEAMIKASIIRSAIHSELYAISDLVLQEQKKKILTFIERKNLNPNEVSFFLYELFIALKQHKLPRPDMEEKLRSLLTIAGTA